MLLLPFVVVDVPPVLDYPNHLARMFVLAHPDDPILSRFYAPHWAILPNLGFDVIGVVLLKLLPVHVAGRLLLALSLLAPVLGVLAYSRAAFGRVTGWALAGSLTAFNGVFFLGFMNFLLAQGLAFAAAGLWLVLRRRGWTQAVIAAAACSALLFLCHIFGVLLFALLIGAAEAEKAAGPGAQDAVGLADILRTRAVAGADAVAPALILYRLSPLSGPAAAGEWPDLAHKAVGSLHALHVAQQAGGPADRALRVRLSDREFARGAICARRAVGAGAAGAAVSGGARQFQGRHLHGCAPGPDGRAVAVCRDRARAAQAALVAWRCSRCCWCCAAAWWRWSGTSTARIWPICAPPSPLFRRAPRCWRPQGDAPERLVIPGLYRLDSHFPPCC